ncbi:MAG: ATP-dependent helicase HrpB [Saccharospirillaceae bacterium]|nr:ATP-dependent helicase HrpB [Pseudomonadales bacterium]NRB78979.1 ATP-dependent helicase HrpB [Saccharospirillaceae bacterium]
MLTKLPIDKIKAEFLDTLTKQNTIVLSAAPGAGKSTRLPLWLLEFEVFRNQKIYLLQPRRLAAKNIACYLASQLGEPVGQTVGYRLRNDSKVSKNTRLEVITEGILSQIIQHDPELLDCALIVLDEFHERSLHGDLAFALARDVQQALRDDLKILLMSATLSVDYLLKQLPDAVALSSEGRSFPVELEYLPETQLSRGSNNSFNQKNKWRDHAVKICKKQANEHQGSILVFLPGVADIRYLEGCLQDSMPKNMLLCPLYGDLPIAKQQQAIKPSAAGQFKMVLATNIAETSLTIEGVNLVIDCGFEKVASYDEHNMTSRLKQQSISKASATQRMGRAGRLEPGKCLRLCSKEHFGHTLEHSVSEIQQADLLPLLMQAARWGVTKLIDLPLIEQPPSAKENRAWQELKQLKVVDQKRCLTAHGEQVAKVSSHPRFAHMMIAAKEFEQTKRVNNLGFLACLIASFLEDRDFYPPSRARSDCNIQHRLTDIVKHQNSNQFQSEKRIYQQAIKLAKSLNIKYSNQLPLEHTGTLLALAFSERIAKKRDNTDIYQSTQGKSLNIHEEDPMLSETFIVAAQTFARDVVTFAKSHNKNGQNETLNIRLASFVDIDILIDWRIVQIEQNNQLIYDQKLDRITAKQQQRIYQLVLEEKSINEQLTESQVSNMWLEQLTQNGLKMLPFSEKDLALLTRWCWVNQHQSHLEFPKADETTLIEQAQIWFVPFVGKIKSKKQLQKCNFSEMLNNLLDYKQQQQLKQLTPTHFIGPTGRNCPIRYSKELSPTVSMPMQELYGEQETPKVGDVKNHKGIALIIELLSPAKRPIQITQDLIAFWQGSYKQVQKDMKAQYPKHFWPDDPMNSKPTNKIKKWM